MELMRAAPPLLSLLPFLSPSIPAYLLLEQSLTHSDYMWRRKWQPTPVFLPGESHGWRSLVGYSPQGRKEPDTTERLHFHLGSLVAQTVKCLPVTRETWVRSLGQEDPLEKEMATHSSTLAGKFHGWRSLVGYSPQGHKESDTTERLHFHFL